MGVKAWNGERFSDEVVWDAINSGRISGLRIDEDVKEAICWFARKVGIHSIEEMTIAMALYPVRDPEITERFLQAWKDKRNDGPFEELTETYGYPIFRDQFIAVVENRLNMSFDEACALANGIRKKSIAALEEVYFHTEMPKQVLDDLWESAARVRDRRWLRHYASLIFEGIWLLQNGKGEYFAEHPIVFGGILTGERKDDNR